MPTDRPAPRWLATIGLIAGWAWTAIGAGGGIWYLSTMGPLRPTNGWFALVSGLSACPLTATLAKRYAGVAISGWVQLAAAALFIVAGKLALLAGL